MQTPDGCACTWYLPAQGEAEGYLVLFLHGNSETISTHIASVYWLPAQHYNVLLPDRRLR